MQDSIGKTIVFSCNFSDKFWDFFSFHADLFQITGKKTSTKKTFVYLFIYLFIYYFIALSLFASVNLDHIFEFRFF